MRNKSVRLVAAFVALAVLMTACGDDDGNASQEGPQATGAATTTTTLAPKKGGTLTFGTYSELSEFDPAATARGSGGVVGGIELAAIYDTIMRYNPESHLYEPRMAQSLTPNAELTEWTLTLKPNIKFSDGTDYNADAVVNSFKRHVQYRISRAGALITASIKDYVVVDPLTVKFVLTSPWRGFPYLLAWTPGMVPSPTALKACDPALPPTQSAFNLKPVGAGPFTLETYKAKEALVLKRNPTYWGGDVYLDGVTFVNIIGASATYTALKTGTLNAAFIRQPDINKQAKAEFPGYENIQSAGDAIVFNLGGRITCTRGLPAVHCAGKPDGTVVTLTPVTQDKRIRQAIVAAIDAGTINDRANQGAGLPSKELFYKTSRWHTSTPEPAYDPAKARTLVDTVKKEGKWDGSIELKCNNAPDRLATATAVQSMLEAAGFKVTVKNDLDQNTLITAVNVNRDYQIACSGFNISDEQPDVQLLALLKTGAPTNIFGLESPVVDAAIEKARQAKNDADQKAALDEITKYFLEEAPAAIYHPGWEYIAWNKNVQGIKPTVSSIVLFDKAFIG